MALINEIRQREKDFMNAFNSGDLNKLIDIYDDNCTFMPAGREPIHDKKGNKVLKIFQQSMLKKTNLLWNIYAIELSIFGCRNT